MDRPWLARACSSVSADKLIEKAHSITTTELSMRVPSTSMPVGTAATEPVGLHCCTGVAIECVVRTHGRERVYGTPVSGPNRISSSCGSAALGGARELRRGAGCRCARGTRAVQRRALREPAQTCAAIHHALLTLDHDAHPRAVAWCARGAELTREPVRRQRRCAAAATSKVRQACGMRS